MAKIELRKSFTDDLEAIRRGIERLGDELKNEQGLSYRWVNDDRVEFKHKSANGYIQIENNELVLKMKLGMLYSAMAPMIKSRIKELADQHIR